MQQLFSHGFGRDTEDGENLEQEVVDNIQKFDDIITKCAPEWPINQINRIDLAILRQSLYELLFTEIPYKVVIDEAVELAKEYGSESSAKFINGVLGTALDHLPKENIIN